MESESNYLAELLAEKDSLDPSFLHSMQLLTAEINRIQGGGNPPLASPTEESTKNGTLSVHKEHESSMPVNSPVENVPRPNREHRPFKKPVDPFDGKLYQPIKLSEKVFIPIKDYPKFNFVGKLLGPRGNTFKRLQQNTGTKMSILGRGSMRDREKEEELRGSGDAKYTHLSEDLHVLIEVEAPPGQAHARLGIAIEELKKFLVPEINDDIHQEQMREMAILNAGCDEMAPAPAPAPPPVQGAFVRGRARGRGLLHVGRGAPVARGVVPGAVRTHRLQAHRPHLQIAASAARSAAGLPRSPTVAHAAPRAMAPQVGDPYTAFETYEGFEYEAAYPETGEPLYYTEYGQGAEAETYETSYPAPARIVSAAGSFKSPQSRPMKKIFREASQPY